MSVGLLVATFGEAANGLSAGTSGHLNVELSLGRPAGLDTLCRRKSKRRRSPHWRRHRRSDSSPLVEFTANSATVLSELAAGRRQRTYPLGSAIDSFTIRWSRIGLG
jgi:hypothetical protein